LKKLFNQQEQEQNEYREQDQRISSTINESAVESAVLLYEESPVEEDIKLLNKQLGSPTINYRDLIIKVHLQRMQVNSRQWMKEKLEKFVNNEDHSVCKMFWVQAEAGMGKTAFTSSIVNNYQLSQRILAVFFFQFGDKQSSDVSNICKSFAFQMAKIVPDSRDYIQQGIERMNEMNKENKPPSDQELMKLLVLNPMNTIQKPSHLKSSEKMLLVFDALDEIGVTESKERKSFLLFLKNILDQLPEWVRVFITSRPEADIKRELDKYEPEVIRADDPRHMEDLRQYAGFILEKVMKDRNMISAAVVLIAKKSEGRFIYISSIADFLQKNNQHSWDLNSLDQILPDGMDDSYRQNFERIRKRNEATFDKECRPLLSLLVTMLEPLRVIDIHHILGLKSLMKTKKLIQQLSAMFPVRGEFEEERIYVFHKSVTDFLTDKSRSDEL
jgi:hypothetical protein